MNQENIIEKIKELFGLSPDNFNILEEQIDISLQMEYFEFSGLQKRDLNETHILENKEKLFDSEISFDEKKTILVQLASIDNVEAYRTIERYLKSPDAELKQWATLAFQESRMMIESTLLDQNQIFISTGLGGKGGKLRYFIVLQSDKNIVLNETHFKILKKEVEFTFPKMNAELESINLSERFISMLVLLPINVALRTVFDQILFDSNQLGHFLQDNYIITNVKTLSEEEIVDFLEKAESNQAPINSN